MTARVLVIGAGDLGTRLLHGLAATGRVTELVLAGRDATRGAEIVALAAACAPTCRFRFAHLDATRQSEIEAVIGATNPDVIVQCASLLSPWALGHRDDPPARALRTAGLAVALPMQLPIIHATMRAARAVDYRGPIANLSFPDVTNVILGRLGLAPTVGLGNATMVALRVRAALSETAPEEAAMPLVRVVAQHAQVLAALGAEEPSDDADRVRVYLGDAGERADELAYRGHPLPRGIALNHLTAAAAVEVLVALLPGAAPARLSVPGPLGLPGGWPVRIAGSTVDLDLPPGLTRDEVVALNERAGAGDGVAAIGPDGTVTLTERAVAAFGDVAPWATAPLHPEEATDRARRLHGLFGTG